MDALQNIFAKAKADRKHIVLAEGHDPRIISGAVRAASDDLANVTLIGDPDIITGEIQGRLPGGVQVISPKAFDDLDDFIAVYQALNPKRRIDITATKMAVLEPVNFANLFVAQGYCDGSVAGACHPTGVTMRSASKIIGPSGGSDIVSSFFIMVMPRGQEINSDVLIFADCAWVVAPDVEGLVSIASMTADSAVSLLGLDPKVAFLSFSTRGSAVHPKVRRLDKAAALLQAQRPELKIESAVQFDAAINASVAAIKAPNSEVAGQANILIFPNLEAGNIGYKIAERIGGAAAIGPVFQGLKKPANDLSRGCSADDVYNMIAVTAAQAAFLREV